MPPKLPKKSEKENRSREVKSNFPGADQKFSILWGAILILALTLNAYAPAFQAGFIWDDDDMLTENPLVKNGLGDIWFSTKFYDYFPLTLTSFWIEWRLWGMNATGYHTTNILLHAFTSILFWRVLKHLKIPGAWFAGLVFAIHPVNVESVAWITERKNTLAMFFYALSFLFYLKSEKSETSGPKLYLVSIVTFLLALLSKTSVVMFPFVLLGCAWWQKERISRRDFLRTIPFFALSLVLALVTIWFQYNRAISTDVVQTASWTERLAGAGWVAWFYLFKALVPLHLSFVYPRWAIDGRDLLSYLPAIAFLGWLVFLWAFRKSWGKPFLFGLGYFVITLFPVLGFFNIYFQKYSLVADHWQYTSIIGIIALVVGIGAHYSKKRPELFAAAAVLTIVLSVMTWRQCLIYKNPETLWRDTIAKNPHSWIAHQNLGVELAEQGKLDEAMEQHAAALQIKPDHFGAHYSLGVGFVRKGNMPEAILHFREAVRIKPDYTMALNSLAWILATEKSPELRNGDEAVELATRAVALTKEKDASILDTLAVAYAETQQFQKATGTAQKALEIANAANDKELAAEIQNHLTLFARRRPVR